jgi:hypothetical protein
MEDAMSAALSRRSALAGFACLAAPSTALAVLPGFEGPDAGLIEAARRYAQILPIERAQSEKNNACASEALAMCRPFKGAEYDTALQRADQVTGWAVENEKLEAIWDRMWPIEKKALASLPQTATGLRIYALMAAHYNSDLWKTPFDDLDYNQQMVCKLIEATIAVAKVQS